jgi:gliding-associated putative ABC transporter substrate-binding component GldG
MVAMKDLRIQTLTRAAIVLGILILLNIVSIRIFGRLDVTRSGLFTLSDASKELMRSLDDRVTVKAYFTEDLPAPYNNHRREVLDQLNEYRAYARGNLQYEFIDPSDEKTEQEAQQQGVAPVQVQVVKEDKFEIKKGYLGMVFLYEDRKEVLPVVQNTSGLEYEISSTIKRLTTTTRKKLGFLTGQGEPGLNEMNRVLELLRRQYEVTTVDLTRNAPVPQDVAALMVIAPNQPLPDHVRFQIDQYLMRGGRVAFLLNAVDATLQNRFGRALELGMGDLLGTYGLRLNTDLVRDVQCASISIVQQQMGFSIQSQVPFPYLPLASAFSEGSMMVKDLQGVVLFFASSVDTAGVSARGLNSEFLMRSSPRSGRMTGMFMYDPMARFTDADFTEKGIPLAVSISGPLHSAFAGKPVPSDTTAGSAPPASSPLPMATDARIILVGDGDFMRDQYLGNRDNLTLFANMADYLADDAGLISIRSKDISMPPLQQVSDGAKRTIKYGTLIVPPLLIVGYGLLRWRMRLARRKALEAA